MLLNGIPVVGPLPSKVPGKVGTPLPREVRVVVLGAVEVTVECSGEAAGSAVAAWKEKLSVGPAELAVGPAIGGKLVDCLVVWVLPVVEGLPVPGEDVPPAAPLPPAERVWSATEVSVPRWALPTVVMGVVAVSIASAISEFVAAWVVLVAILVSVDVPVGFRVPLATVSVVLVLLKVTAYVRMLVDAPEVPVPVEVRVVSVVAPPLPAVSMPARLVPAAAKLLVVPVLPARLEVMSVSLPVTLLLNIVELVVALAETLVHFVSVCVRLVVLVRLIVESMAIVMVLLLDMDKELLADVDVLLTVDDDVSVAVLTVDDDVSVADVSVPIAVEGKDMPIGDDVVDVFLQGHMFT